MQLSDYLESLDSYQRAVAAWSPRQGSLKVDAGAGSGKTRALIGLTARLILSREIDPDRLVLVTFSNNGASVMRGRLQALLPKNQMPRLGTFHSLGLRKLRELQPNRWEMRQCLDADAKTRNPDLCDNGFLWRCAVEFGRMPETKKRSLEIGKLSQEYARIADLWRARGVDDPWKVPETKVAECPKKFREAWDMVNQEKAELEAWDFNDVLSAYLTAVQNGLDSADGVMVDESQDNSRKQLDIALALARWRALIGDTMQCVHVWRGAYPELFQNAEKIIDAKTIVLPANYRSTDAIVTAGKRVAQGKSVPAFAVRKVDDATNESSVKVMGGFLDNEEEAAWTAKMIESSIRSGVPPEAHLVLCRTNALMGTYQAAIIERGYQVAMAGGKSLFAQKEALVVMCYAILSRMDAWNSLEQVVNAPNRRLSRDATVSQARRLAPSSGGMIPALRRLAEADGRKSLLDLAKFLQKLRDTPWPDVPSAVVQLLVVDKDLKKHEELATPEDDRPAVYRAAARVAEKFKTPMEFMDFVERMETAQTLRGDEAAPAGKVLISTIHRSKGSEADVVFVPSSDGVLPHWRSIGTPELEDEVRLIYVAITRAKNRCVLTWNRQSHGQKGSCYSGEGRFLKLLYVKSESVNAVN